LSADQGDLCWAVAKDVYALNDHNLELNAEGVPVLQNCLARFECTKTAVYEGGDHVIMLGQVNRAEMREEGAPLAFYKGQVGSFTAH